MKEESRAVFKTVQKWYILSISGSIHLEYTHRIFFFERIYIESQMEIEIRKDLSLIFAP